MLNEYGKIREYKKDHMKIGYKGFREKNGKLYCRDMEFKIGEIAEVPGKPIICKNGIHFCWNLNDINLYYNLRRSVICEVEPLGDIVAEPDGEQCCTNRLKVIRILSKEEVWRISNTGSNNTGYGNTGDHNTGDRNTGDRNTGGWNTGHDNTGNGNTGNRNAGYCNTGDCNAGDYNTGNCNTGNRNGGDWNTGDYNTGNRNGGDYNTGNCNTGHDNTGNCNTGHRNTGHRNTGNWNTGDYNTGNWNTGFFNAEEHECYIFDKPSGMKLTEFFESKYYAALNAAPFILTEWVLYTDEEKAEDKSKEFVDGYFKRYDYREACANWWKKLSDEDKATIQQIPNFDADKFEKITGIKV